MINLSLISAYSYYDTIIITSP